MLANVYFFLLGGVIKNINKIIDRSPLMKHLHNKQNVVCNDMKINSANFLIKLTITKTTIKTSNNLVTSQKKRRINA